MAGKLFIISAPSGAGKTSLVQALLKINASVDLSVSYTTRAPRDGEVNGQAYHFVDRETFLQMAERGEFLESAEVYGNFYGTSQVWINERLSSGRDVLLEIDWQGAEQVRRLYPNCISIFILPPSRAALLQRLTGRGKDSAEVIARRMAAVSEDVAHVAEFDYVIINDQLDVALAELNAVFLSQRILAKQQIEKYSSIINHLQSLE